MYSIVLMAALTAGEATPNGWGHRGCVGYANHGGFAGCWGVAGCFQCHGCHGCYGCYGCHGFGACYGACYGVCYGGFVPYGGAMGYGWAGGWGLPYGCYGPAGHGFHAPMMPPAMPPAPSAAPEKPKNGKGDKDGEEVRLSDRARLIVSLPAEAKLYVDDQPIAGATAVRTFRTPQLASGQTYYYDLKAEVTRDGKPVTQTRRVVLRAGEVIRADFSTLAGQTGVASAKRD
jgi:uncharacterized protein (TIGR03000 family)